MKLRIYREFTELQLIKVLKDTLDVDFETLELKEMTIGGMFGDYLEAKGYKFKKIYGNYICMATPTEEHEKPKINIIKARTDSLNYKK